MKLALAFAAFLALASPVVAQECTTLDKALSMLKGQIPDDKITVTDDVALISAYHKALGVDIPDGSQPVKFIMAVVPPFALIGIVEPDGCIKHSARISLERHLVAIAKAAGV